MPDVAKCRQWLEKNFPNEFAKLTVGEMILFCIVVSVTLATLAELALK